VKQRPKHLVLILAREFASNLATPTLITDHRGRLVFFNEAAEAILGRSFAEVGELPRSEWPVMFSPRTLDDVPLAPEDTPGGRALRSQRPVHDDFRITGLDGVDRDIAATVFPLFAHVDEFSGVVAIFWDA
jgi:PAS domain-containing protein